MTGWLVLQLADSAFPTGGFAHSAGLEASLAAGLVRASDVPRLVRDLAWQTGRGMLPFVTAAHATGAIDEADARCDAFLANAVVNRASRTQGRALVDTAARVFERAEFASLAARIATAETPGHLAPSFGAVAAAFALSREEACRVFVHQSIRGALSAAVRLGVVGPYEAQRVHAEASHELERVVGDCVHLSLDDAAQTSPILDLASGAHDRLYTRLFQS